MKRFSLSANIETGVLGSEQYIVTPNAKRVAAEIVSQYQAGIHSFSIVGTYGTGKSSFLLSLIRDLQGSDQPALIQSPQVLANVEAFEVIPIVGTYASLEQILSQRLTRRQSRGSALAELQRYSINLRKQNRVLLIVIDEFGKHLEYATKHEVEKELYFVQQLAEIVNAPTSNILLITSLHQNFGAYTSRLTLAQRNEWSKVKGRFYEVVFAEPVEQLLYLAAESLVEQPQYADVACRLGELARQTKFITPTLPDETIRRLFPLDAFSAVVLTKALQRYGQNERSLFSFINSRGEDSIYKYDSKGERTYSLNEVYDYIIAHLHSYLRDANADSMAWSAIAIALERIEVVDWETEQERIDALKIAKVIGLINLFGNAGFAMPQTALVAYAEQAMTIADAHSLIERLVKWRIIRYAEYKQRFILFEGTDVNIEEEIAKALTLVPIPTNPVDELRVYFNDRTIAAKAYSYQTGTPRHFEYVLCDEPIDIVPKGEIDGYIELIFSIHPGISELVQQFSEQASQALVFVVFNQTEEIIQHLHKIQVYDYILDKLLIDKSDKVALREVSQLKSYEQSLLNQLIYKSLYAYDGGVTWYYKGEILDIKSQKCFYQLLSKVCYDIYPSTPILRNELINRHKLTANISTARVKYLQALIQDNTKVDLGFEADKFPPEKTIYYTLLKATGLHKAGEFADMPAPKSGIYSLWCACDDFLDSTRSKPRKVSDLIRLLSESPYKVKMGVLDFWIPTYLYIKRLDYSLFGGNGAYIPDINMECFELMKRHPADFTIKAYSDDGIKLAFYNQYRKFINAREDKAIKTDKFIETVKPFFVFYNQLNDYAKHTCQFDCISTLRFRDALARAKDPEKTFFEELPEALGYDRTSLLQDEFVANYCNEIQKAVTELRLCYTALIDRIERQLIERIGLQAQDYNDYIGEVRQRLEQKQISLLSAKQQAFYNHAMSQFENRNDWYQSIAYVALEQPLDKLRDSQEEMLIERIVFLFRECEEKAIVSAAMSYKIDIKDIELSLELERKIEVLLSENENLNIYTLMNLLKKKMK